jgi:hypothetical protein
MCGRLSTAGEFAMVAIMGIYELKFKPCQLARESFCLGWSMLLMLLMLILMPIQIPLPLLEISPHYSSQYYLLHQLCSD